MMHYDNDNNNNNISNLNVAVIRETSKYNHI